MSDPVEQAAEAILRAEGRLISQIWAWDELHEETQAHYLKLARAAIDALGLTEEWAVDHREPLAYSKLSGPPTERVRAGAETLGKSIVWRLVSRWVGEETKP